MQTDLANVPSAVPDLGQTDISLKILDENDLNVKEKKMAVSVIPPWWP